MKKNILKIIILGMIILILTSGIKITSSEKNNTIKINCKLHNYLKIPSYLKKGDILFCDVRSIWLKRLIIEGKKGYSNDHCAMYIGNNRFIEASPYIPFLFGPYKNFRLGVVITPKFILNLWATNFTFGYVNNVTSEQREGAIKWAKKQLLSPYQWSNPKFHNYQSWHACPNPNGTTYDPEGNKYFEYYPDYWICSELLWAAYLNQSKNLSIGALWLKDEQENDTFHWFVSPQTIIDDKENITLYSNI